MSDAFTEAIPEPLEQGLSVSCLHNFLPFFLDLAVCCTKATASVRSSSLSSLRSFFSSAAGVDHDSTSRAPESGHSAGTCSAVHAQDGYVCLP
jgi:hypothetical protein